MPSRDVAADIAHFTGGLVYRVAARFGIPHGPGAELVTPGPQRIALYQLTRPEIPERMAGRRDF